MEEITELEYIETRRKLNNLTSQYYEMENKLRFFIPKNKNEAEKKNQLKKEIENKKLDISYEGKKLEKRREESGIAPPC